MTNNSLIHFLLVLIAYPHLFKDIFLKKRNEKKRKETLHSETNSYSCTQEGYELACNNNFKDTVNALLIHAVDSFECQIICVALSRETIP